MKIIGYEKSDKGYFYKKVKENNEIKKIRISADEYSNKKKIQKGGSTPKENAYILYRMIETFNTTKVTESNYTNIIDYISNNDIDYFHNLYRPTSSHQTILERIINNITLIYNNDFIFNEEEILHFKNFIKYNADLDIRVRDIIMKNCDLFKMIYDKMKENKDGKIFERNGPEYSNHLINMYNKDFLDNKYGLYIKTQLNTLLNYIDKTSTPEDIYNRIKNLDLSML